MTSTSRTCKQQVDGCLPTVLHYHSATSIRSPSLTALKCCHKRPSRGISAKQTTHWISDCALSLSPTTDTTVVFSNQTKRQSTTVSPVTGASRFTVATRSTSTPERRFSAAGSAAVYAMHSINAFKMLITGRGTQERIRTDSYDTSSCNKIKANK